MPSLNLTHHQQQYQTDCLPACAAMVLSFWGINVRYGRLRRLLKAGKDGTPFSHISRLTELKVIVSVDREYSYPMERLGSYLSQGLPLIASVDTAYLPYWAEASDHAVVVIGRYGTQISIHDPWLSKGPTIIEQTAS